ncbi:MAG TPA: hypothetical protein VIM00_05015, partial [Candidatus Acidoferrum sp.]
SDSAIAVEIEELRQTLQSQQEQLTLLKEELAKRDRQIDAAREAAAAANSRANEANVKATEAAAANNASRASSEVLSNSGLVNSSVVAQQAADSKDPKSKPTEDGPASIRYKGVTLTPGGFIAAESVSRTRATSADIATPLTSTPFSAAGLAHVSENAFTGRQSRATLLIQTKIGSAKAEGYYEADFLGVGTSSNNRQSNSYVFRQRQIYAQAAFDSGVIISGGQMWSLVTENKKGIWNRQENLTAQIDPNYIVGFTWARQYGLRIVKDFGGKFSLGASIEGPQATIGGRGFSSVTTINSGAAPSTILTSGAPAATSWNFFLNAPGAGGGLNNAFDAAGYSVNKAPDLVFKAAADPGFGHYEVFGVVSFFRDRVYPCGVVGTDAADTAAPLTPTVLTGSCASAKPTTVSSYGATNSSTTGGGIGASATIPFHKKLEFGVKAVAGDGIGRYGSAQLADATARPDGTLALIRTAHGLARLEVHPTPKLDLYGYWGLEYAWRAGYSGYDAVTITKTVAIPATATTVAIPATTTTKITTNGIGGYGNFAANNSGCATEGAPINDFNPSAGANCAGDIRIIQQGTLGFWYRFYQGPKGRFQFGMQYSYLDKNAWSGTGGVTAGSPAISPKAINNMVWTSFRYYLP